MSRARRLLVVVIGLFISAGALFVVLGSIDLGEAAEVLRRANPLPLLAIIGIVAFQVTLRAERWSILIPTQDGMRVPVRRLLPPLLVGYLGNAVLPARLGEPMRAIIAGRRERLGTTEVLGSVALERIIDVATLALVACGASMLVGAPGWTTGTLGLVAALGVGGIVVLSTFGLHSLVHFADRLGLVHRPSIRSLVVRFTMTVGGASRRRAILAAAGVSVIAWLLDATSFVLAARSVGVDLSYGGAVLVAGVAVLGTAIPSAPGYVGTFELAAAGTAVALGLPGAEALALAVVVHVMTLLPLAVGGAISLVAMGTSLGEVVHAAEVQPRG